MVYPNLRIAPILRDFASYRRLRSTSGKIFLNCGAFRRRYLMNCLLFIVLLRLSCCHGASPSDLASQYVVGTRFRGVPLEMGLKVDYSYQSSLPPPSH